MATTDFDFLLGDWRVAHRKLATRLTHSDDWHMFGGTMRARPILSGHGNFDENAIDAPEGRYEACSLRLYDPAAATWSIHWIDGRFMRPDPPMLGRFTDGAGTFFGDDRFEGRPVRVRFLWSRVTPTSARWEQAFSADGGTSWETNWIMDFSRI